MDSEQIIPCINFEATPFGENIWIIDYSQNYEEDKAQNINIALINQFLKIWKQRLKKYI